MTSRFEIRKINWWNKPVGLYKHANNGFVRIGWVWNQTAYLVNNLSLGWIAFEEYQTDECLKIWSCPHCGKSLWFDFKDKIIAYLKKDKV